MLQSHPPHSPYRAPLYLYQCQSKLLLYAQTSWNVYQNPFVPDPWHPPRVVIQLPMNSDRFAVVIKFSIASRVYAVCSWGPCGAHRGSCRLVSHPQLIGPINWRVLILRIQEAAPLLELWKWKCNPSPCGRCHRRATDGNRCGLVFQYCQTRATEPSTTT